MLDVDFDEESRLEGTLLGIASRKDSLVGLTGAADVAEE